jgi:hypothetical protein
VIALSLLEFNDPEAQAAAEPYLEDFVKKLHEEKR